jgi:hypothetical protein
MMSIRAQTAAALFFAGLSAHAQPRAGDAVELREGILVGRDDDTAYVMAAEGGVGAIDLRTGKARWRSDAASKPLAVAGSTVVAQVLPRSATTNTLELAALDAQRGNVAQRSVVDLPPAVRVSIGETLKGKFSTRGMATDGSVVVHWEFAREHRGGMSPDLFEDAKSVAPAFEGREKPARLAGAVRMDLATGRIVPDNSAPVPPSPAWVLSDKQLDRAPSGREYQSADGLHMVVSERVADDRTFDKYRWTVYERGTRRQLGQFRTHVSFSPFVVRGVVLAYTTTPLVRNPGKEEPAMLRGVDIARGAQAWSVPVREVVWRGPLPP